MRQRRRPGTQEHDHDQAIAPMKASRSAATSCAARSPRASTTRVTGAIADDDTQLTKFHGIYQQDDRDLRPERAKKKLEKASASWRGCASRAASDAGSNGSRWRRIARERGNGTLRLTTRQTIQFHGIIKSNLQARDPGDQRGAARHHRGLRRRQPQRDRDAEPVSIRACHAEAVALARAISDAPAAARAAPSTRSGSTARRSRAARRRTSRSTAAPTCRASSRSPSRCRRRTMSTCSRTTSASSRSRADVVQRRGRRRHGHDPWRARHLPAHRRRHRLLHARRRRSMSRRRSSPSSATGATAATASMRG